MDADGFKPAKPKSHRRKRRTAPFKKQNKPDAAADAGWGQSFQAEQGAQDWSGWEDPPPKPAYTKGWEYQTRVDRLRDVIPFWRDGVYAALEGRDVPKMEEFLERVYSEDAWGMSADSWGVKPEDPHPWATGGGWNDRGKGWGNAVGWGSQADRPASDGWGVESVRQDDGGWNVGDSGWDAGQQAEHAGWDSEQPRPVIHHSADEWALAEELADPNTFVDQVARLKHANGQKKEQMRQFYSMPTHVKVQKIEEMARALRELR